MRPSSIAILLLGLGAAFTAGFGVSARQAPSAPVSLVKLPIPLPAIGNLGAVQQWRLGRIEGVEQVGDQPDVLLSIRTEDDQVHRVITPRLLAELARASKWTEPGKARPGSADYVERMIAFDVDASGRLIAMMSLEPMDRNRSRLRRALR